MKKLLLSIALLIVASPLSAALEGSWTSKQEKKAAALNKRNNDKKHNTHPDAKGLSDRKHHKSKRRGGFKAQPATAGQYPSSDEE